MPRRCGAGVYRVGRRPTRRAGVVATVGLHVVALLAVVSLVFALPRAMPGDPLAALQDPSSSSYLTDPPGQAHLQA